MSSALEAGHLIDGKYRVMRLIGTGGMGAVYEAVNSRIRRRVAIKILSGPLAASQDVVARFEREAEAAGRIGNDHILEVLDIGALPDGTRYMVMEYLEGETLLSRIQRYVRMSAKQIAPLTRQFLSALAAAHGAGIIHRDLKPENIFILREKAGQRDFVKLIDFGVSKFADMGPESFRLTRAGAFVGTPCYMAPEQARGSSEADVRSDIYAVGVILYEAVTGRVPFDADSFNDLMFKIALSDPVAPSTLAPDLEPGFEKIILKAMARDPKQRFQSVEELIDTIDGWMELRGSGRPRGTAIMDTVPPIPAPRPSLPEAAATLVEETGEPAGAPQTEQAWGVSGAALGLRAPRRRVIVVAAAGAAALALLIGVIAASSSANEPPKVAISPPVEPPPAVAEPVPPPTAIPAASPSPQASPEPPASSARAVRPPVAVAPRAPATGSARPKVVAPPASTTPRSKPIDFGY